MSSASTALGIPLQQSTFLSPVNFNSNAQFQYVLGTPITLQPGNYLVWYYFQIKGNADTEIIIYQYSLNNFRNTLVHDSVVINDELLPLQSTQIITINTPTNVVLNGLVVYDNTQPDISGTIVFSPL